MQKFHSRIAALLALQLSIQPFFAFAEPAPLPAPVTSGLPRTVVLEIQDGRIKAQKVEQVADDFREALQRSGKLQLVPKQQTYDFLASRPQLLEQSKENPYARYLEQAKEFYRSLDFNSAVRVLEQTIDSYRAAPVAQENPFPLPDAYRTLGNYLTGAENRRQAENAFLEAIRLDPQGELSEADFPPSMVETYRKLRREMLPKMKPTVLDVRSNAANTQIYLNGQLRGQAPLRVDSLAQGEHFLTLIAPEFQPEVRRIEAGGKPMVENFEMKKSAQTTISGKGLQLTNLQDVGAQVQAASAIAEGLQADKVILVGLEERGWNYKITARMVDRKYKASYKQQSIEVVDLAADSPAAVALISKDLENMAQVDLGKSEKYADNGTVVLGRKRKKSMLKSPLLWGLVGVLVAGGATAGVLATRGGDEPGPTGPLGTLTNINGGVGIKGH